jgi:glycosyltransferase involved in cell wall biosynthesis
VAAPSVTVVIPTRDRWELLPTALDAVFRQEGVEVDAVVVDDASTRPAPPGVAREGVALVRLEQSLGLAGARNAGIARAGGDWIAFLDDDDVWSPNKLRRQLDAAEAVGAGWAYSTAAMIDADGVAEYIWPLPEPERLAERLVASNAIPAGSSNVVGEATLLHSLGGFDEAFSRIADWDMWLRLAVAAPAAAVAEPLVAYRQHVSNMSGSGRRALLAEFDRLAAKHHALAAERGLAFDRAEVEQWAERERRRGVAARARAHLRRGKRARAAATYAAAGVRHASSADLLHAVRMAAGRNLTPPARVEAPSWLAAYR